MKCKVCNKELEENNAIPVSVDNTEEVIHLCEACLKLRLMKLGEKFVIYNFIDISE